MQMREISKCLEKVVCFRSFMAHFRELLEGQGGNTCMNSRTLYMYIYIGSSYFKY